MLYFFCILQYDKYGDNMEMEQKILEMIKNGDKALSVYDIYDALGLKSTDDLKELLKVLNKMEDNLQIYKTKKDNYMLFSNSHLKIGTMNGNKKGFGFVDIEGDIDGDKYFFD